MSRDASISLDWADGTYVFSLKWGEIALLQEATNTGPYVIFQRLHSGAWRLEDLSNIIRLGLIGGGMTPTDALSKTRAYVEKRPPLETLPFAIAILSAGLLGAPDEPLGEQEAPSLTDQ